METVLVVVVLALNLVGAFLVAVDKRRARRRKYRIREATLWGISLCGAALGVFVTMLLVRHKTNHLSFMLLLPLIAAVQIVLLLII